MAKRKKLNRRVLLLVVVFTIVVGAGGYSVWLLNLPKSPEFYKKQWKDALAKKPKDYQKAINAISKAIKAGGDRPDVELYYTLAEVCFDRSSNDQSLSRSERSHYYRMARSALDDSLVKKEDFHKARKRLAEDDWGRAIYIKTNYKLWRDFIDSLDIILSDKSQQLPKLYYRRGVAKSFLAANDPLMYADAALADLNEAVKLDKTNVRYWDSLAKYQERLKKLKEAEKTYKQAIKANPTKAEIQVFYSRFLRRNKREKEAFKVIGDAIKADPKDTIGYLALADFYIYTYQKARDEKDRDEKILDKAIEAIKTAKGIDKTDVRIYRRLMQIYRLKRNLPMSIQSLRDGIAVLDKILESSDQEKINTMQARVSLNYWLCDSLLDLYYSEQKAEERKKILAEAKDLHAELQKTVREAPLQYKIAGRIACIEGEWEQAKEYLNKAPQSIRVVELLIEVYERLRLPSRAEKLIRVILKQPQLADNPRFLLKAAQFRINMRDYSSALSYVQKALQADPENKVAHEMMAALNIIKNKSVVLPAGMKETPMTRMMSMRLVENLIDGEQYDWAAAILEKLVAGNPKDYQTMRRLLALWTQTGQQAKALKKIDEMLKKYPEDENYKILKKLIGTKDGKERFEIEKGILDRIDDKLQKALAMRNLCFRYGRTTEALEYLNKAEKINPDHPVVIEGLFRNALASSDWAAAEAVIGRLKNPEPLTRERYQARLAMAQKQWKEAISLLKKVLESRDNLQADRLLLGECLVKEKKLEQAKKQFEIIVANDHKNISALLWLAKLAIWEQRFDEADSLIRGIRQDPRGRRNKEAKAIWLERMVDVQDTPEAIRERTSTFEKEPKNLYNVWRLAMLYEKQKQFDLAQAKYEYYFTHAANKIAALPRLAAFYRRIGRSSKADELFVKMRKSVESDPPKLILVYIAWADYLAGGKDQDMVKKMFEKAIHIEQTQNKGTQAMRAYSNYLAFRAGILARQKKMAESQQAWRHSISELQKVIDLDKDDVVAKRMLYRRQIDGGMIAKAIVGYKELIKKDPSDSVAMMGLGLAYLRMNRLDEALKEFNRAIEVDSKNAEVFILRSEVHRARGDLRLAVKDFRKAIELVPNNVLFKMDLGKLLEAMRQFDRAIQEYDQLIVQYPEYEPAYERLINLFLRQKKWRATEKLGRVARKKFGKKTAFPLTLARMWKARGNIPKQIEMLKAALDIVPESVQLARFYLIALQDVGQFDKLAEESQKYLARPAHKSGIMAIMALAAAKQAPADQKVFGQFIAALRETQNPAADVFFIVNLMRDAYGSAAILAKSAEIIKARPNDWQTYMAIGNIGFKLKKYSKAELYLIKARKLAKTPHEEVVISLRLAACYGAQKQYLKAEKIYKAILAKESDNLEALNNLSYYYADKLDRPKDAKPLIERAMSLRPGDVNLLDTYAWTLAKLGDYQQALSLLKKVMQDMDSPGAEILYHMGHLLKKTGDFSGAEGYHRRVIEMTRENENDPIRKKAQAELDEVEKVLNKKK
ncbi:MAG: tetratricopeptide repeat protein [Phycisphaerae bacterium]|nr:tetratricopeptide repeat protein [Phycisphaerae bacterium]